MHSSRLVVSLVLATASSLSIAAGDEKPNYSIRESDASTGSNVRRSIVSEGSVPFEKGYAQLTPQEQARVKSQYERLGPADEPPYPVQGTKTIYQAIAAIQQKNLVEGDLSLLVDINSAGEPTSVSALKSPSESVTRQVATVLMLEKYKPAQCGGKPCAMQFPLRVSFTKR